MANEVRSSVNCGLGLGLGSGSGLLRLELVVRLASGLEPGLG